MADSRDITGKNRKFTGTSAIKLPSGTTAQRVGAAGGEIRFNNETNLAEYYTGTDWKAIDAPPTITQFTLDGGADVTSAYIDASAGGNATIEVKGSLFDTTGAAVTFVGTSETISTQSITRNSANLLTVTVARSDFDNANEPYAIKVTNGSGLSAELADAINQDAAPAFSTAAGNIGTAFNTVAATFDAGAVDPDSDTITYSISAGALPSGLSINSSTGSITGTPSGNATGDYTFTVSAATSTQTSTRQFIITIADLPSGGSITLTGNSRIHHFTSSSNFVNPLATSITADVLVVGGGGGGGSGLSVCATNWYDGGGGGAGGLRFVENASIAQGTTAVTIGGGGAGANANVDTVGAKGGNTSFSTYTGDGGGGGESRLGQDQCSESATNLDGGSGGGRSDGPGRAGNATQSPGFGNNGGVGTGVSGGGGGGAGAAGQDATGTNTAGAGGVGRDYTSEFGSTYGESGYFAGGGGGGASDHVAGTGGAGGTGGGGNGRGQQTTKESGTANTGGGGGGGAPESNTDTDANADGSPGGSGVVLVKYDISTL